MADGSLQRVVLNVLFERGFYFKNPFISFKVVNLTLNDIKSTGTIEQYSGVPS